MEGFLHKLIKFLIIFILLQTKLINSQINDNYISNILEEGDYELLDVTDYHNINLIVSTSKNIYSGIPPNKIIQTEANLINATSLITINDNYLFAACLSDSFLTKIRLSDGSSTSLLEYSDITISPSLEVPLKSCSLSYIDDTIFIGYSRIVVSGTQKNLSNIVFKIGITDKNNIDDGPIIDDSLDINYFTYPEILAFTSSSRHISCEPLRILNSNSENDYRLICLHEGLYTYDGTLENIVYATSINSDFSGFDYRLKECQIKYGFRDLGFRIYRENDTFARCMTSNALVEVFLNTTNSKIRVVNPKKLPTILYSFDAQTDLFSYNNKFRFSVDKASFMGKEDIYVFQINNNYYENYFQLYALNEENTIKKILGYYNEANNKIICLFQTNAYIKYFIMDYKNDIFSFGEYSKTFQIKSYEKFQYNLTDLTTSPDINDLGILNPESIVYYSRGDGSYDFSYFGTSFYENFFSNNILIQKSLNEWKTYHLSFIDNVENDYTRIYHLNKLIIEIQTCNSNCDICLDDFDICTDCTDDSYAKLEDKSEACFPKINPVEGYIYDSSSNKFLKCYESCEYCSKSNSSSSEELHNCVSCLSGYLYSYANQGNCYKYEDLEITEEKQVVDGIFISSTCSNYKISSTGECIDQCPINSVYYSYEYDQSLSSYEKVNVTVPKYLFNKVCYEECPVNSEPDNDNNCICKNAFYKEAIGENIVCLSEDDCPNEYPIQNKDTKECYESLEKCDYFFGDDCYDNCPSGKVKLSLQNEEIQNYIIDALSLNDTLKDKICICDKNSGVWSNINTQKHYYQECLSSCPDEYIPEDITKQCVLKSSIPTTIITTIPIKVETTIFISPSTEIPIKETTSTPIKETTTNPIHETTSIPIKETTSNPIHETTSNPIHETTSNPIKETTSNPIQETTSNTIKETTSNPIQESAPITNYENIKTNIPLTILLEESKIIQSSTGIINNNEPNPQHHPTIIEQSNCSAVFENTCYEECPQGTCLTQDDPGLKTCVRMKPNTQVFNSICFDNFESLTKNIKSLSENNEVIESTSGVIIRGYSISSNNDKESIDESAKYSIVYLGDDCEKKLSEYYNLTNDIELFILGIDSPNKDISATTNTYNYGVYLADGTLLDHNEVCKESKISISSPITNPELVKLNEASYFSDMGYDIFNEESSFYNDYCSPASIDGNDIILSDRKKDFYPSDVSLCNESCYYSQVDFNSKRFTCECDLTYNFSQKNIKTKETSEEENVGYIDYLLSLINYKIIVCYKLFFEYESYYYNAGFYIAVGTLIFCLAQIFIFIKCGLKRMNINILENIPNKLKLLESMKEKNKLKLEETIKFKRNSLKENPPKKDKIPNANNKKKQNLFEAINNKDINQNNKRKSMQLQREIMPKRKSKAKSKTTRTHKSNKKLNESRVIKMSQINQYNNSNDELNRQNNDNIKIHDYSFVDKYQNSQENNNTIIFGEPTKEIVEAKEINTIPYFQALRADKRNYAQIFLSVIYSEIKIIRIFYYKNTFEHLSIILSEYVFELCLDLTLNCILYTEDVISEKYNNNGSIKFFTTLSLSFVSNIVSSIICFVICKLSDYAFFFELIIKDVTDKNKYFLNMIKFKKFLCIKLSFFFIIQTLINLGMCYYLMIFCTVYHKTQGSIMINYLTGIAESMAISLGLTIITSLMRYLSIKYRWKSIYYTSKYFFENF